jgi:VWFA-related protein
MSAHSWRPMILGALWLASWPASRAQPPTQQAPVIQVETRTVLVDAIVTGKKGDYVHDLSAQDFRIWQDGKEQAITSLSSEAKSAEPHFLVLFFDETRMAAQDLYLARQAASRFIDANSGPRRQMAIVSYNSSLTIVQNFTDNAGRLKDALNRLEASTTVNASPTGQGRDRSAAMAAAADNFGSRNMMQALAGLAQGLGVLPGRKSLVLLTAGIPSSAEAKSMVNGTIESASRSGVAIYPVNVRPVSVDSDPSVSPQSRRGRRGLQGGTDDSTPANQDPAASSQPLLTALANGTGGFLTRDSSELLAAFQQIGEEQNEYYLLSYTPPESKEGSCHALRVKVERAGVTVRARSAYCTTQALDLIAGTPEAKALENRVAGAEAGDLTASVQLPYFYVSPGVARVHLVMEISLGSLKFENQKGKPHAEVNLLGIASTPAGIGGSEGGVGARFSDTLKLDYDTPAEVDKLKGMPVHYEKDFKIAPGRYSLTVAFGSGSASFGKMEAPLEVEPWNGSELAVSGIALSRETHPAGDLGLVSSLVEDRAALTAEGAQFVPSGSNRFAKSEPGFFYIEVYDPDPPSVGVRVRVLDRKTGESKWDSGVTKLPLQGNAGRVAIPAGASLPLNTLAAGAYQLEITASDSIGKQVKRTADFEVK